MSFPRLAPPSPLPRHCSRTENGMQQLWNRKWRSNSAWVDFFFSFLICWIWNISSNSVFALVWPRLASEYAVRAKERRKSFFYFIFYMNGWFRELQRWEHKTRYEEWKWNGKKLLQRNRCTVQNQSEGFPTFTENSWHPEADDDDVDDVSTIASDKRRKYVDTVCHLTALGWRRSISQSQHDDAIRTILHHFAHPLARNHVWPSYAVGSDTRQQNGDESVVLISHLSFNSMRFVIYGDAIAPKMILSCLRRARVCNIFWPLFGT